MIHAKKKIGYFGILLPVAVLASCLLVGAQSSDLLKYSLTVKPVTLTVDRMPTTSPPKSYTEEFSFTVTNPTRTDFKGSSPDSPPYAVEVFFVGIDKEISVWKSPEIVSHIVTPVTIEAGKTWTPTQKIVWTFKAADVKDGKYHAVATFIPTKNKTATANFEIKSVN